MAWRLPVRRRYLVPPDLQFVSCFDELKDRRAPRSRPGHRPEVGPPVLLIFGDAAGLRVNGARAPTYGGDGARRAALFGEACLTTAADRRRDL